MSLNAKTTAFFEVAETRRSVYGLTDKIPIADETVVKIVETAIKLHPTSFNNQGSRAIVLFGAHHKKLWDITLESLKAILPPDQFPATEGKITNAFASGYGTVLYFVDRTDIQSLEQKFPTYAANFAPWGQQSIGMAQYIVWAALASEGIGASLQHYGELIKEKVREEWSVPASWELISQQPFGAISAEWKNPEKTSKPLEDLVKTFN